MNLLENRITRITSGLINCRGTLLSEKDNDCPTNDSARETFSKDEYLPNENSTVKLNIFHTNDLHGRANPYKTTRLENGKYDELFKTISEEVGGLAEIAGIVNEEREKNPEGTLLLDAGDISTGTPVSDFFNAEPMMKAMNQMNYDAMVIGNHEFDKGKDSLKSLLEQAEFPVLASNLVDREEAEKQLPYEPYILKEINGVNVGIIGLTTPDILSQINQQDRNKIDILSPVETANEKIPEMREKGAEFIIALSHQGIDKDRKLAEKVEGIDLIIGGHCHTETEEFEKVNDTLIVQAGGYGEKLGQVEMILSRDDSGMIEVNAAESRLIPVTGDIPKDPDVESVLESYNDKVADFLEKVVGESEVDLINANYRVNREGTNLANFFTDTVREETGAELCLFSNSSFRGTINSGEVKVKDIFTAFPWDDGLSMVTMDGEQLKNVVERGLTSEAVLVTPSGFEIKYDPGKPKGERIVEMKTDKGEPIETDRTYKVATRNFLLRYKGAPGPFEYIKQEPLHDSCQDIIIKRFESDIPVNSQLDGRIQRI
jgi:2',3'-cyclic-nucleotide 2'-phosphodiesterase (5'-nucleotidase family)